MKSLKKLKTLRRELGFWNAGKYLFFTVLLEKVGISLLHVFSADGSARDGVSSTMDCDLYTSLGSLSDEDLATLREYGGDRLILQFEQSFRGGCRCAILRDNERPACICWLRYANATLLGVPQRCVIIEKCFTLPGYRGKGLYPNLLRIIVSDYVRIGFPCFIECIVGNKPSERGIRKAGFHHAGYIFEVFGRRVQIPLL